MTMDLFIAGKGKVRLGPADFVGQGGEASVYASGDLAFKIYTDPSKMISPAKIRELADLTAPNIVRPQSLLLDRQNQPVGYTMRRVRDAAVLCRLFNRTFRERQGLTPDAMLALVRKLQTGVRHVHDRGILIVDLNEMNFLLDGGPGVGRGGAGELLFIDVDSYQTPGFPATAIMDSIRDRHATGFSPETDWFSFGIVSFQMLVGIHPYKGKHPSLTNLDARMQGNVSVFNPHVTIPQVCYPFDGIPQALRDWYRAVFEDGKRLAPPTDLRPVLHVAPTPQRLLGSDRLLIRELRRFPAEIHLPVPAQGTPTAVTAAGLSVGDTLHPVDGGARIGFTARMGAMMAAWLTDGKVTLYDVADRRTLPDEIEGEALTAYDGRIYVKNGTTLYEIGFLELPSGIRAAAKPIGNVMAHATQLYDGVAVQSVLGACYVSVFPRPGRCHTVPIPELDGHRIVDARFENGVLMLVGIRDGRYDRLILRFDDHYRTYDVRAATDIAYAGLNFTVLDNGVCVHVNENEELELFTNRPGSQGMKVIVDPAVQGMRLFRDGTQVLACKGDTLYAVSLRK
jgi:serine/threonine protein kinase